MKGTACDGRPSVLSSSSGPTASVPGSWGSPQAAWVLSAHIYLAATLPSSNSSLYSLGYSMHGGWENEGGSGVWVWV